MKYNLLITLSAISLMSCSKNNVESQTDIVIDSTPINISSPKEEKVVVLAKVSVELSLLKKDHLDDKMAKGLLTGELETSLDNGLSVSLKILNNQSYGVPIQYRSGMSADLHLLDFMGN